MTTHSTRQAYPKAARPAVRLDPLARPTEAATPSAVEVPDVPVGHPVAEQGPTLTVAEAATLLGVGTWLVQQQVARRVIPAVRLGRRILISRSRLLAWLDNGQ